MNRKWFIHCLSVVLFFIERSVIFGNHIVEQRNKPKKNMSEKLKTFVGQMCNEMSVLPTMVHSCANDATIFPPLFFLRLFVIVARTLAVVFHARAIN